MSPLIGAKSSYSTLPPFAALSPPEQTVLEHAFEGLPNKAIAARLQVSVRSVERRKATALHKLGVKTVVEAAGLRNASPPPADDFVIAAFRDYAIPLSIVTPDLRFAAANGAYCRVLGYSEAELVGKTIADLSHPDDRSSSVRTANELFTGAVKEFRLKKRYRRRSGDYLMVELNAVASLTPEGTPRVGVGRLKTLPG